MKTLTESSAKERALIRLEAAVKNHPDNAKLKILLANCYQQAAHFSQAETIYREMLIAKPNHPGLLNNLAMVLAQQKKQLVEALSYSQQAHQFAPNNAAITDTLGWLHYVLQNYPQARKKFELALTQQAQMPEAQCHLGLVMHQQGEQQDARALLENCLLPSAAQAIQDEAKRLLDV
jgi:Flp pilus assembly protein TadD